MPKNITGQNVFTDPVIIPQDGDPVVISGPGGTGDERAWQALANRTTYLKDKTDAVYGSTRFRLTATRNYYVSPAGSDSNDGLDVSRPWRTLQQAWEIISDSVDLAGHNCYVNLAAGTYGKLGAHGVVLGAHTWGNAVVFQGVPGNPRAAIIDGGSDRAVACGDGAQVTIKGVKIQAPGVGGQGYFGTGAVLDGCVFGACGDAHVHGWGPGLTWMMNPYTVDAGARTHWEADAMTMLFIDTSAVLTIGVAGINWTTGFTQSANGSQISIGAGGAPGTILGPGAGTGSLGRRFVVFHNAIVTAWGTNGNKNTLPGNAAGEETFGGIYIAAQ